MSILLFSQQSSSECAEGGESPSDKIKTKSKTPSSKKNKLQLILVREELLTLTGDPRTATILGQFLSWSQRVPDFDLFLAEEKNFSSKCHVFEHGWFYKTVQQFMEETKLSISAVSFRRYLGVFIDRGWVQTRVHSETRGSRTTQYRVNLRRLYRDLQEHGYSLPGFTAHEFCPSSEQNPSEQNICNQQDDFLKKENV
ncbi:MAG: hypothetical protein KBD90_05470 [Alphaproteobacteria bacterium]|nr:hypothetical protein [Alphaproteobacteria bacterium]